MEHDYLVLEDGSKLHELPKTHENWLNKSSIYYGPTGTGKTTLMFEALHFVKPYVSLFWCVCPTNESHGAYNGIIPSSCIKPGRTLKKTIAFLEAFLNQQAEKTAIYKRVHSKEILKPIFDKNYDSAAIAAIRRYTEIGARLIRQAQNSLSGQKLRSKIKEIKEQCDVRVIIVMRKSIRMNKHHLMKSSNLTEMQRQDIKFLDLNPRAVLILDDCVEYIGKWCAQSAIIDSFFFSGRHYNVTLFLATQSDSKLKVAFRGNSTLSFFASEEMSNQNFGRNSNGFDKSVKKYATKCNHAVFKLTQAEKKAGVHPKHNRKKLARDRITGTFYKTKAQLYDDVVRLGDKYMWEIDDQLKKTKKNAIYKNSIYMSGISGDSKHA
jgi:hypothetical protein